MGWIWLSGRLSRPRILPSGDNTGERLPVMAFRRAGGSGDPFQELSHTDSDLGLSGHDAPVDTFEGFPNPSSDPEGALSRRQVLLSSRAAAQCLAFSSGGHVIDVSASSRFSAPHAVLAAPPQCGTFSVVGGCADLLGQLLPPGSSVVVRCQPSRRGRLPRSASSTSSPLHRRVGLRLGCSTGRRPSIWLVVSGCFKIFHQPPRTPCCSVSDSGFSTSPPGSVGLTFNQQHDRSSFSAQGGGHEVFQPQCSGSGYPSPLRGERSSSAPPVCSRTAQCPGRLPQLWLPSPGFRMDPLPGGLSGAFPSLAGHHRPVRYLPEPPSSGLFFANGGSTVGGDRCYAPNLGQPPNLRVPSVWLHSVCPHQGSPVVEPRADLSGSLLAPEALVPGSLGAPSGCAGPSAYAEGSTQTTPLPSLPSEPPLTTIDWLSYCERTPCCSVSDSGFSTSPPGSVGLTFNQQHDRSSLSAQGGGHEVFQPQCSGSGYPSPLRGERSSSAPPVCSRTAQCPGRLPQLWLPSPGFRMDPLPGGLSGAFPSLAGHHRPVRYLPEPPSSGLFFANGGSTVSGDRCYAPNLGQPPSLRVPSVWLHSVCPHQGSPVVEPRADLSGSLLAPEALVPGSLGAPSGCAGPSAYAEGSTQTTPLPSLPSGPPLTTIDWLSYCERSARHLGFSSRVARQLTFCRRSSTRVNYQAKWVTYCTWCRTHGHSISRPSCFEDC